MVREGGGRDKGNREGTRSCRWHTKVGGRGRNRTLSDAVLETAALPVSYTPDIWHRLPVTIQRLCGHNAALCH